MDLDTFAAERDSLLTVWADLLRPVVADAVGGSWADLLDEARAVYGDVFDTEGGTPGRFRWDAHRDVLAASLDKTTEPHDEAQVDRIALWMATYLVNAATYDAAPAGASKTWVTMRDENVRDIHAVLHGETVPRGDRFQVGEARLRWPGEPVGPPEVWINCRCVLAIKEAAMTAAVEVDVAPDAAPDEDMWHDDAMRHEPLECHGVLAPEGIPSGDGRMFSVEALSWRDLPIPLMYQAANMPGHDGSVVVGQIATIFRDGNLVRWSGRFADTAVAEELVGLIGEGHIRGISVDVDSAELAVDDAEGENPLTEFAKGRISAATVCAIPAFAEAYIALGPGPLDPQNQGEPAFEGLAADGSEFGERAGIGGYPIENCGDLRNAIQAIGRARPEDRARTIAHIKSEKARLGCPDVDLPESWADEDTDEFKKKKRRAKCSLHDSDTCTECAEDADEFNRGPGWVTDPVPTARIHHYWTKGEGAAKIRWGTPGDFTRCTRQLRKYVGPQWLNRTCAQWHHDALGYWPGQKGMPGNPPKTHLSGETECDDCETTALVASVNLVRESRPVLPAEWFADPGLTGPTPVTVTDDGRVFGHLATWGTCHIGIQDACVTPPTSRSQYGYFRTGVVLTDAGEVPVGSLTMDTGHAPLSMRARPAAAHYDNTGAVVADVAAGEDAHGIWVAGAMRAGLDDEQIARFRASALSGDWRSIAGNLELVGALAVNIPGFPIPRASLAASAAEGQTALIAAGIVTEPNRATELLTEMTRMRAERVLAEMGA